MSGQPKHLPVLMAMFPGVAMLNVSQVAEVLRCAEGHLYNLSSAERLPFKLSRDVSSRFLISIVELAAYMDKTLLSDAVLSPAAVPTLVVKRKPGRPLGSTRKAKSSDVVAFQDELSQFVVAEEDDLVAISAQNVASVPFYVDVGGRIIAMALTSESASEEQLDAQRVLWLTWVEGLAAVWRDEEARLGWLRVADQSRPDVRREVETLRHARMLRI